MSSPTKRTICIDDLPPEMICAIFEHLHPKDLASCSMVNRRWHAIHAGFKLHRLVVTDYHPTYDLIKWYHSNQPIQEAERCRPAMFLCLEEKPLLSNLRHLAVAGSFEFDFNKLNRFRQLVHLEICIGWLGGEVHLNLPRLRVLAFHRFNSDCALSIDCPELSTLFYYNEDRKLLDVKHPETIRKLETRMSGPKLALFKSVECLVTKEFEVISKATLLSLPNLRELRYDQDIGHLVDEFDSAPGTVDRVKRTLSEFLGEAKKLRGSDFRFTFSGFQLTNVNVDQIDFGVKVIKIIRKEYVFSEYVYMKNCHLIEPDSMHFVRRVDYTSLMRNVTGEFPRCFFQKFTGIEEVKVAGVVKDSDHFIWFLKSLRFLRSLELSGSGLGQEFYDQLPAIARSLVRLELSGLCEKTELQLNFDFLCEFSCLSDLSIYPGLSVRSATSLVRLLGGLKEVYIYLRSGRDLLIVKQPCSTVWKVQVEEDLSEDSEDPTDGLLFETENPSEIANFFEERWPSCSKIGEASD